jgi:CRP/FNR family cyclic AMP-dependent transcriptional regulator
MPSSRQPAEFAALMVNPLYAEMPVETRTAIEALGRMRRISAGEQLFERGAQSDGVYALLSGQVEYSAISPSGRQSIINIVEVGKWLGDVSTLDEQGRTMDCWALTDSALMHLSVRDFSALFHTHGAFARMLILIQGQRLRDALTWIEALTKLGAEGRLAERFLLFSLTRGEPVEGGIRLDVVLTQEVLAQLIGTTRQRVNQVLNAWQETGVIRIDGRHVIITDIARLKEYVDLA